MPLFANNWINLDLKNAANNFIIRRRVSSIVEGPIPSRLPKINKNLQSGYFNDMTILEKHAKLGYSKDLKTGKHKKSSYLREFAKD